MTLDLPAYGVLERIVVWRASFCTWGLDAADSRFLKLRGAPSSATFPALTKAPAKK
jgi:hypothetical protein